MKLQFGSFTLIDSPAVLPYRNLRLNGTGVVQEAQLLRAAARTLFDRANQNTTLTVETSSLQASQGDAESYLLQIRLNVVGQQTATFITAPVAGDGNQPVTLYLHNAVIPNSTAWLAGCTVYHQFTLVGGQLTTT